METSSIILLAVSASISFALGRTIMHFRNKKINAEKERLQKLAAQALKDAPPEAVSKNKSKRKRQMQNLQHGTRDER
jgi:Na+-translocating ferredoxin:NAD+ oxidoreductase RnfG subunit